MSLKKNSVIFYEAFEEEQQELRRVMPESIDAQYFQETIQELGHSELLIPVISVRTQSDIPLAWSTDLQGVLTRSTGYDHLISYQNASRTKAACGHLPSYCSRAVAEQTILMLMALWRKLPQQLAQAGSFCRDGLTGRECLGKALAVVGVGRIGRDVIKAASSLGMRVRGIDIDPREPDVEYVSFQEGIEWADAVVSAVPLNSGTLGLFNQRVFKSMKPSAVFVNISRGEVSPLSGVKDALDDGMISGAALDVYDNEGSLAASLRGAKESEKSSVDIFKQLQERKNVILTPHNAFNTQEAVQRKARQSAETLAHFFKTGRFIDNVPERNEQ